MSDEQLQDLLRPVVRAAFEAGQQYERQPADRRGPEPALDDGTARGLPPGLCAAVRPHVRRVFEAGRERERGDRARWDHVASAAIAEFGRVNR